MNDDNIFIKSLKFSYDQMAPFSYMKLMEQLKAKKVVPDHYLIDRNYPEVLKIYEYIIGQRLSSFDKLRNVAYSPTGEAYSRYVEFMELKLSREAAMDANRQATRANNKALWAIAIALLALIAQVVLGL